MIAVDANDLGAWLGWFSGSWVFGVTLTQVILIVTATYDARRIRRISRFQMERRILGSHLAPRISILVPAYNEEVTVTETVEALLALSYPNLEVVVVNDGSKDRTVDVLVDNFDLIAVHPVYQRIIETAEVRAMYRSTREEWLVVVDKENGGKADSLNTGINVASGSLVCVIDADTLVAPDALQKLVVPYLTHENIVAVGGTVRLTNDSPVVGRRIPELVVPKKFFPAVQAVEYLRAFLVGRVGWNPLGGNLIISGAFGLFERGAVLQAGGYEAATIGEDMELVVRMRRHGYETDQVAGVGFLPDPVAWTEAPEDRKVLARQRNRWQRGLMDVLWRHRRMLFNPRYGSAGMLAMPFFFVVEFLSPIVEAAALIFLVLGLILGFVPLDALWFVGAAYGFGTAVTVAILCYDDWLFRTYPGVVPRMRLVVLAFLEQLVYRPMTIVWRLWGVRLYLQGRTEWGAQVRKGFSTS